MRCHGEKSSVVRGRRRGTLIGSMGGWELSRKSLSEKVTFEPTHDRRNGVSQVDLWGKTIKADGRANAKVLWKVHALSI